MQVVEVTSCPGCRSSAARTIRLGTVPLRRCRSCSLVYATEVADPGDVYTDDYLAGESRFGANMLDPVLAEIARRAAVHRFEAIERRHPVGSLLDVGCGTGEALDVARGRGWRATGVEVVEASAGRARAKGLDVRTGDLDEVGLTPASFDVVAAWHVVEHMTDAVAFLETLARYARPGGVVAVEVPNWWHAARRSEGATWEHLRPLEHVAHYTPLTLRRTMRRAGLRPRVHTATVLAPNRFVDGTGRGFAVVAIAPVEG